MYAKLIDLIPLQPPLWWVGGLTLDDIVLPSITVENNEHEVTQMPRL